jgi:parallel beta-helix repeat protein
VLALVGVALALAGGAGPAGAASPITNCNVTIAQAGAYFLARDLSCPGTGITITADDVRLDLNGRTLAGTEGDGTGVLAQGDHDNPTLTGLSVTGPGTVRGFAEGVLLDSTRGARGARVTRVTVTGNRFPGILVRASPDARVTGNTAKGNGFFGIFVLNSEGSAVAGNRAAGNGAAGINIFDTPRARIADNTATGNRWAGIDLASDGVDGSVLRGNTATGNGGPGIRVAEGATGNTLERNRTRRNDPVDLADGNACANTWRDNDFRTDSEGDGPKAGCIR